jgi:hypothetical protein
MDDIDKDEEQADLADQLSNHYFSAAELGFIERKYGSIREFMASSGLGHSCFQARGVARSLVGRAY